MGGERWVGARHALPSPLRLASYIALTSGKASVSSSVDGGCDGAVGLVCGSQEPYMAVKKKNMKFSDGMFKILKSTVPLLTCLVTSPQ